MKKYIEFINEAKIKNRKSTSLEEFTIDYDNGITCDVVIENGVLKSYQFLTSHIKHKPYSKGEPVRFGRLNFVNNIKDLQNTHWSEHYKMISESKMTLEDLENFKEFDKLFYVGGGADAMLRDHKGNALTSLIKLDYTHNKIWNKINTLRKAEEVRKKADSISWVKKCDLFEIPYYNRDNYQNDRDDDDDDDHRDDYEEDTHSVECEVLLPQELYTKILGKKEHFDDICKMEIMKIIME